eukprot:TRINITY_DN6517_c0_g1_i2.p1 TRINITY_DN6517_c0_g1~~TRINITY_DN6517_c0_g1_i2.p1  ORF type:complete len:642 (+),score=139.37 TRINITY_DN6517_c0_g1_i2:30-1928(+)
MATSGFDTVVQALKIRSLNLRVTDMIEILKELEQRVNVVEQTCERDGMFIVPIRDSGTIPMTGPSFTTRQVTLLQALARRWIAKRRTGELRLNNQHRDDIVKEIIVTERTYNAQLATTIDLFLRPLRAFIAAGSVLLTNEQLQQIFSDIEMIHGISDALLAELETRYRAWSTTQAIADIFIKTGPYMRGFRRYFQNYDTAIGVLTSIRSSSRIVGDFFYKNERDPRCARLPLSSLLIVPIQRMPRYILLLSELIKHTPRQHPDYQPLERALSLFRTITTNLNEGMKDDDSRQKLLSLQQISDMQNRYLGLPLINIMLPHRKLIRYGTLTKKSTRTGDLEYREAYLCTDAMITVTPLPLFGKVGVKVDKIIPLFSAIVVPAPRTDHMEFFVVSPSKTHLFIASTPAEGRAWEEAIQDAIARYIEQQPDALERRHLWLLEWTRVEGEVMDVPRMIRADGEEEPEDNQESVLDDDFEMMNPESPGTSRSNLAPPPRLLMISITIHPSCQAVSILTSAVLKERDMFHLYPDGVYITFKTSENLLGFFATGRIRIRNKGPGSVFLTSFKRGPAKDHRVGGRFNLTTNSVCSFDFLGHWCIHCQPVGDYPPEITASTEVVVEDVAYRGGGAGNALSMA